MGRKVMLEIMVEVEDYDLLYARARANGYPATDDREAVVGAIVGTNLDKFGYPLGLIVHSALARREPLSDRK